MAEPVAFSRKSMSRTRNWSEKTLYGKGKNWLDIKVMIARIWILRVLS